MQYDSLLYAIIVKICATIVPYIVLQNIHLTHYVSSSSSTEVNEHLLLYWAVKLDATPALVMGGMVVMMRMEGWGWGPFGEQVERQLRH